jgi:AcrR family transcriptional regulator
MATRRRYRLGKRAELTAAAKRRVIDAALALFRSSGFHDVSLDSIARRARIGRTTLFELFGSKTGLLQEVEAEVSRRAGVQELLSALAVDDGRKALDVAFVQGAVVWSAERALFRRLFGQATVDKELARVMGAKDAARRELCRAIAQQLARQKLLKRGLTPASAAELLWLLTGFHTFDALAEGRSPHETGERQWRIAQSLLLVSSARQ